jgi:hypothetical protein
MRGDKVDYESIAVKFIRNTLNLPIQDNEVEVAHPLPTRSLPSSTSDAQSGASTRTQDTTLMVRYRNREVRDNVISRHKVLKGTNRAIVEDLTALNIETINRCHKHEQVQKTWSWNGHIYATLHNDRKITVRPIETIAESVARQATRS